MNIFISVSPNENLGANAISKVAPIEDVNILCSFEYLSAMGAFKPRDCKNFIADSGAFTAMNAGKKIDNDYIDRYIQWIVEQDIEHFIEMDLDEVIGYDKTLQIRHYIEQQTGKCVIPCWHLERGADGWRRMCDEYDYVAISLSRMTKTSKWLVYHNFEPLKFFLAEARKRNARVHALGCNDLALLKQYHFYSADSSTHTTGSRYGRVMVFRDGKIQNINKQRQKRINYDKADKQNIQTMIEVMRYAETHL